MLYSSIVKRRIRQSFDHVNDHRWDELLRSIAPNVHHRFLGAHAIGGERHDRETLRLWFERLARVLPNLHLKINDIWVKGWPWDTTVFVQWDGTASLLDGGGYSQHAIHVIRCGGARSMPSMSSRIRRKLPVRSQPRQQLAWTRLPPNRS